MITTGDRLEEERKRLGLSQQNFADLMDISRTSQVNYETNKREPSAGYLAFSATIGVDVLYVLTGERLMAAREIQDKRMELRPDEAELLINYRHIPEATRRSLRTVIATCAQVGSSLQRKHESPMQTMVAA